MHYQTVSLTFVLFVALCRQGPAAALPTRPSNLDTTFSTRIRAEASLGSDQALHSPHIARAIFTAPRKRPDKDNKRPTKESKTLYEDIGPKGFCQPPRSHGNGVVTQSPAQMSWELCNTHKGIGWLFGGHCYGMGGAAKLAKPTPDGTCYFPTRALLPPGSRHLNTTRTPRKPMTRIEDPTGQKTLVTDTESATKNLETRSPNDRNTATTSGKPNPKRQSSVDTSHPVPSTNNNHPAAASGSDQSPAKPVGPTLIHADVPLVHPIPLEGAVWGPPARTWKMKSNPAKSQRVGKPHRIAPYPQRRPSQTSQGAPLPPPPPPPGPDVTSFPDLPNPHPLPPPPLAPGPEVTSFPDLPKPLRHRSL
ncbi:hypothetical protein Hypma_006650 [Hypsizygus marmoreus]|uniref:Uncharacterized protein n=1 Tax=Hypsizygus marmoreus TaxID=39966 RepID=A0A369K144_HYPMA|nr:hypothetical protein Hypma_006650 [Hypsizygus marmoreus]